MVEAIESVIERFTADGAYDTRGMYVALAASGAAHIKTVIPPMKTAAVDPRSAGPWRQRNDAIKRIAEIGGMYRYKRIIGDHLRAKQFDSRKREALIAVNVINRMTALGMPESVKVAA